MKINVLMTGLVPDLEKPLKSRWQGLKVYLKNLQELKQESIIDDVFIEQNDSWQFNVEDLGFKFVKGSFPNPNKQDKNYFNQIAKIKSDKKKHCLNFIRNQSDFCEDTYIIYCRPDVYLDTELIREYAKSVGKCSSDDLFGYRLLKDKIWIANYDLLKPFYMNDLAYFAHIDDFDKLIDAPSCLVASPRWHYGVSHIREFVNPFVKTYPDFEKYINGYDNIIYDLYPQGELMNISEFLSDPFYTNMMTTYYKILQEFFVVFGRRFKWDDYRHDRHYLNDYVFDKSLSFIDNVKTNVELGLKKAKGMQFKKDHTFFVYQGDDYTKYIQNPFNIVHET